MLEQEMQKYSGML